jgi:uncharacterized protein (DUF1697 family)
MSATALTLIALLRGVNVGGSRCKMSFLKELMLDLSPTILDAQTYLQSGNIVLSVKPTTESGEGVDIPLLEDQIGATIKEHCGFEPAVFVMTVDDYSNIMLTNPYVNEANRDMKKVHMFLFPRDFTLNPASLIAVDELKTVNEKYMLITRTLFLHTPDGFGISKLARKVEKLFGASATARNWSSATSVLALAESMMTERQTENPRDDVSVGISSCCSFSSSGSSSEQPSSSQSQSQGKKRSVSQESDVTKIKKARANKNKS